MSDDFVYTECPSCGTKPVYDNRAKNKERVAKGEKAMPEWKCPKCDWLKWAPRLAGQGGGRSFSRAPQGPKWESWEALETAFRKSAAVAVPVVANIAKARGVEPTMADYLSATATVFIAASRDGVKAAPKSE